MMRIKDRITLGVIAGLSAAIPGALLGVLQEKMSLRDMRYRELASTLIMPRNKVNTTEGKIVGQVVNGIGLSLSGIVTTYLLSATGRDYRILKGIGVSYFFGVILGGAFPKLGLVTKLKYRHNERLFGMLDHAIHGSMCALIVSKLGDDKLFPMEREAEEIPLFNINDD
jgi:hypothetical protein